MTAVAQAPISPVRLSERIAPIDTLRGVAVLGILTMNIVSYALPSAAYFSPVAVGDGSTGEYLSWLFAHLFFDMKMMAIFSMLFGAGMILMWERAEAAGRPLRGVYYRRILWLLVFGLVHAYFLWYGDILVTYALCGLLLYLFRRRKPRTLILIGIAVLVLGSLLKVGSGFSFTLMRTQVEQAEKAVAEGSTLTPQQQAFVDSWRSLERSFAPTPDQVTEEIRKKSGSPSSALRENARETVGMHLQAVPFMLFWRAFGVMLLGMGLMKLGVFSAKSSPLSYALWVVLGVMVGLPLVGIGVWMQESHNYDFVANFFTNGHWNYWGSLLVAMGYVGAVMLICQSGKAQALQARFAAAGRMALTNYLMQTVICVLIFSGYGLGLFGSVPRAYLWLIVIGIWIAQLLYSPWWLTRFQFGPAEWLWRSLTYMRRQPMRTTP